MNYIELYNHESRALADKRLGVLVRVVDPQPEAGHSPFSGWPSTRIKWIDGESIHFTNQDCFPSEAFLKTSPFIPGAVLGCREHLVRSQDGWWGQYEADGEWVTSQPPAVPARICWWSRKDRSLAPSQKTERLSSEQCPNFAVRRRVKVGEVRCVRVEDVTEEEMRAWGVFCPEAARAQGRNCWMFGASLFEEIHGPGSWEKNLWVWVTNIQPTE
jgi:hypothetical protein